MSNRLNFGRRLWASNVIEIASDLTRWLRNYPDFVTQMGFLPFWPGKWPWRSIMTMNLKSVTFVPYVSLFSVSCITVLATFGNFHRRRRLIGKKPHIDLRTAGKNVLLPKKWAKGKLFPSSKKKFPMLSILKFGGVREQAHARVCPQNAIQYRERLLADQTLKCQWKNDELISPLQTCQVGSIKWHTQQMLWRRKYFMRRGKSLCR